jgi:hypothetical protein
METRKMKKETLKRILETPISKVFESHFNEESHVSCMWNYWHPIAQKTIDGVVYRITEGLFDFDERKKTYLLYKNENLFGVFNSVDGAKKFVDNKS